MYSITVMARLLSFLFIYFLVCWMTVLLLAMIRVWCDTDKKKLKYSEKNLYKCQFAHHRSHRD